MPGKTGRPIDFVRLWSESYGEVVVVFFKGHRRAQGFDQYREIRFQGVVLKESFVVTGLAVFVYILSVRTIRELQN